MMKAQLYYSAVRCFVGAAETSALKWKEQQQRQLFSNSNNQSLIQLYIQLINIWLGYTRNGTNTMKRNNKINNKMWITDFLIFPRGEKYSASW